MRGLAVIALALCAGCNTLLGVHGFDRDAAAGDGTSDAPGDGALVSCGTKVEFGPLQIISELDAALASTFVTDVSADGTTIYVASDRDGTMQVYSAERSGDVWGALKPLTAAIANHWITVDGDATSAVFAAKRPGDPEPDLYYAEVSGGAFAEGTKILHTAAIEATPRLSRNRATLYYASKRDGGLALYRSKITGRDFDPPTRFEELGLTGTFAPALTADELVIYFSKANASELNADVYTSDRDTVGAGFNAPVLVSAFNSGADEVVGALSPDGCTIYVNRVDPAMRSHPYVAVKPPM